MSERIYAAVVFLAVCMWIELAYAALTHEPADWREIWHTWSGFGIACMVLS